MKKFLHLTVATTFFLFCIFPPSFAFNVNVVQGNATVTTSGNAVTITATSRAILQGNTSIPANVTVKVVQGLNDILLRDTTGSPTDILGSLFSNGNIILINSMGVFIGQSANINVGGLIASTLDINNQSFLNGSYQFTKIPGLNPAEILNEANISVANGGYVILLADRVVNRGTITAYMGTVALGSGQQATVSFDQGGLVNLVIDQGLAQQLTNSNGKPEAQIVNSGSIYANGGKIQMTAQLFETTLKHVIDNTGIIEADNVVEQGGEIELTSNGAINNDGIIQTGTLIEQGETFRSKGVLDIGHGYFENLDGAINISGNISGIYSDVNDIDLTGAVTLTGDTTLQADSGDTGTQGEIVMNGYSLTGGGFDLTMIAGLNDVLDGSITGVNLLTFNSSTSNNRTFTSTGTTFSVNTLKTNYYSLFSRSQGSGTLGSPYMIYSDSDVVGGLQYIPTESLSAYYELANNIDASETSSWNGGAGFVPISTFTGTFDGNNYTISNLFINLPSTSYIGLFGQTSGATIENVGLINANITGSSLVGGFVGYNDNFSSIDNSYVTGSVNGSFEVGGLVGFNYNSSISNSYAAVSASGLYAGGLVGFNYHSSISDSHATGNVSGSDSVGGLVGYNSVSSSIDNSYATGTVSGYAGVGGLVGDNNFSSNGISDSYATGNVSGNNRVGGLVGQNYTDSIDNSYATGSVSGTDQIGGLVGYNGNSSSISNSYATGNVSGGGRAGGLVGYNLISSSIDNSYATGSVSGSSNVGGLIGYDDGSNTLTNNWWYNSLSNGIGNYGPDTSVGQWQEASGYSDFFNPSQSVYTGSTPWDISSSLGHTWAMSGDDDAYPLLQFRYSTTISDDYQLQLMFLNLGASYSLANNIDASDTSNWNAGNGFAPIGIGSPFTGTFNGNNYTISNLFIDFPSTSYIGLFGQTSGATIENVGLINANITGASYVGGLAGTSGSSSSVDNSYVTGSVSGSFEVGGLVGWNDSSSIANSYATADVSGLYVGGLVGYNSNSSTIDNSYATGNVSGTDSVGGLVGNNTSSITNSYATGDVNGNSGVGGLAGDNNFPSSSISNSYATGSVNGNSFVGGLAGQNYASSIDNSYATGNVSGNFIVGGLVGYNTRSGMTGFPSSITNSFATGNVNGNDSVGGFVGQNSKSSIVNSYSTGSVSGSSNIGGLVGYNLISSSIDNSYATGSASGGSNVGGLIGYDDGSNTLTNNWWYNSLSNGIGNYGPDVSVGQWQKASGYSDFFNPSFAVYIGSTPWDISPSLGHIWAMSGDDDAYPLLQFRYSTTISDDYQLQLMFLNLGTSYSLANNIDASDTSSWNAGNGFAPIGISLPFTGTFNGNNYTISNLFINLPSTNYVGLFGQTSGATIENVGLVNVNITGQYNVGGLVGYNNSSTIDNSYVTGSVNGIAFVGGLVGQNNSSSINNSYATGDVSGSESVGGLVGGNYNSSNIDDSYATGSVSGADYIGGLVGVNGSSSTISNSYATGTVNGSGNNVGGLVGLNYNSSTIDNSYATGTVSGNNWVGGLVGFNTYSNIDNSYATGSVTGGGNYVGGLVGFNGNSSIDNSYATGDVSGSGNNVGGLVGGNYNSSIDNNYSTGIVSGCANVGGLVGNNYNSSSIDNSYATGSVSGSDSIGGLIGSNNNSSSITSSFATGAVTGSTNTGGLIGYDDGSSTLTNNWWYNSLSNGIGNYGPDTSVGQWQEASGNSDFYSSSFAVYTGSTPWDFSSIWYSPSGTYPQLR